MKELRKALHEGPKQTLISASHLPARHPFAISFFIGGLVLAYLFFWQYTTDKKVDVLQPQITEIVQAVSACTPPVPKARHEACIERIEAGLKACRRDASCRDAFGDVLTPPPPRRSSKAPQDAALRGSNAHQPGSTGSQPSGSTGGSGNVPTDGGGVGDGAGRGGGDREPQPGNSGEPSPAPSDPPPPSPGGSPLPPSSTSRAGSPSKPGSPATPPAPTPVPEPRGLVPDLPSTVEAAGKAVEQTTEGARGVVEEAGKAAGCVLRGEC